MPEVGVGRAAILTIPLVTTRPGAMPAVAAMSAVAAGMHRDHQSDHSEGEDGSARYPGGPRQQRRDADP
ncbi:hypothetical protein N866_09510 [Actinotalea ferrariae CF5-4]|uniref:Uncharacterized protein n=1 Tax=Actinotalea ferrariae CF5-4 TaxID=948458 RepID=A0A021VTR3_9CELL|nr:hypothetical protein N866_09510 [Actinotalea ferrariae CF5-4]